MTVVHAPKRRTGESERKFFFGVSVALLLFALIGFSPTYYLVSILNGTTTRGVAAGASLTPLVHLHAAFGTVWLLLLVAQTGLVSADRRELHMKLGMLALPVGLMFAVTAYIVAVDAARRGSTPPGWAPAQFLLIQLVSVVAFVVFASIALLWRRYSDWHKRLIILATVAIMVPAGGRLWGMLGGRALAPGAIGGMCLCALFLISLVAFDLRSRGRLHPATLWGGAALVLGQLLSVLGSDTDGWLRIGRTLVG
jgi:hypothetical protein